jgi:hypothetical protein
MTTYTGEWSPAKLAELADLIGVSVAAWNGRTDHPDETPAAGQHDAAMIKAAHAAVTAIDDLVRHVYILREHLVTEMRADEAAHMQRADELLAESRARRERQQQQGLEVEATADHD